MSCDTQCERTGCEAGEKLSEKGEEAVRPRYSTQAAAAADGRDLADMEEGLKGEDHAPSEANDKLSDMKTISLSQVDAPTLAAFEVSILALHGH